jgi:crotonobetainyl-CoA:carnitine CoA-transferase CaiB-like acyl-CoA transferase
MALDQRLADWLSHRTRDEIVAEAQAWRLPVMPVLSESEVWDDVASGVHGNGVAITGRPGTPFRITYGLSHPSARLAAWPREQHSGPLADIRVLDLGMVWAGPYCGRLLTGLGAEVIKVEGPRRRDGTRPANDRLGCVGAFADLNQGKASLVLDLSRSAGQEAFLRVAARADVVLDNFSPRVMPNFGLDYRALAQVNPALLRLALPAFRSDGPWAHHVAYGSGLELATGLADPGPDGRPTPAPVPYLDYLAGTYGAVALVATLLARDETGRGAHIEVAQHDVARQVRCAVLGRVRPPVSEPPDANSLLRDPHLRSRGLFARRPLGDSHPHYARPPWRLGEDHQHPFAPAPAFGASTRQVLREVGGLSPAVIERLIDEDTAVALVDGEVERAA